MKPVVKQEAVSEASNHDNMETAMSAEEGAKPEVKMEAKSEMTSGVTPKSPHADMKTGQPRGESNAVEHGSE